MLFYLSYRHSACKLHTQSTSIFSCISARLLSVLSVILSESQKFVNDTGSLIILKSNGHAAASTGENGFWQICTGDFSILPEKMFIYIKHVQLQNAAR